MTELCAFLLGKISQQQAHSVKFKAQPNLATHRPLPLTGSPEGALGRTSGRFHPSNSEHIWPFRLETFKINRILVFFFYYCIHTVYILSIFYTYAYISLLIHIKFKFTLQIYMYIALYAAWYVIILILQHYLLTDYCNMAVANKRHYQRKRLFFKKIKIKKKVVGNTNFLHFM